MGKVIDIHVHIGTSSSLSVAGGAKTAIDLMDKNGVDCGVAFPMVGFEDPNGVADMVSINDQSVSCVREYPERFPVALGEVEPRYGKACLDEVDRVFGELKLRGLMFHNDFCGVPSDAPIMFDIIQRASKYPNPVIMLHSAQHSMLEAPFMHISLAMEFPEITFVILHPMMSAIQLRASVQQAKLCPNIYFDTCMTSNHLFLVEEAVQRIGANRIMFGSDNPYYQKGEFCYDKYVIENARISEADRERIFCENARELFGIKI